MENVLKATTIDPKHRHVEGVLKPVAVEAIKPTAAPPRPCKGFRDVSLFRTTTKAIEQFSKQMDAQSHAAAAPPS
jgi:hypothetical protein